MRLWEDNDFLCYTCGFTGPTFVAVDLKPPRDSNRREYEKRRTQTEAYRQKNRERVARKRAEEKARGGE